MLALPFVFVAFVINFPAGLLVYWITTNLWTVGQQPRRPAGSPRRWLAPAGAAARGLVTNGRAEPRHPTENEDAQDRDENGGSRDKAPPAEKAAPEKAAPRAVAPPPPPRKKKKRSGRRR